MFKIILYNIYLSHIHRANLIEKDKCLAMVKVYGVNPRILFKRIIKNILMAQWTWPGEFIGLKFNLNSSAKFLIIIIKKNLVFGLDIQKIPGTHNIVKNALIQLALKFSHRILGSKIENKLPIIYNNKFLLILNKT